MAVGFIDSASDTKRSPDKAAGRIRGRMVDWPAGTLRLRGLRRSIRRALCGGCAMAGLSPPYGDVAVPGKW